MTTQEERLAELESTVLAASDLLSSTTTLINSIRNGVDILEQGMEAHISEVNRLAGEIRQRRLDALAQELRGDEPEPW